MSTQSCSACCTHLSIILWRSLPNDSVKFQNLRFNDVNTQLSLYFNSAFTSPFAACSGNSKGRSNNHNFSIVYFQVTFSLQRLTFSLLKLPNQLSKRAGLTWDKTWKLLILILVRHCLQGFLTISHFLENDSSRELGFIFFLQCNLLETSFFESL